MSLVDLTNFPPALKKLVPFISRANEVGKRNPNVAYFCLTYALDLGVKLSKNLREDREAMGALVGMMEKVEKLKETLKPNVEEGRALMELYSLKIFKTADDREHSGDTSKSTMLLYLMSSYLMETTKQFVGGMSVDICNKQKYARWRAVEIRKHLKGGVMEPAPPRESDQKNVPNLLVDNNQPPAPQQEPEMDSLEAIKRSLQQEEEKISPLINYNNPPSNMSLGFEIPQHGLEGPTKTPQQEDNNILPFWMREDQQQQKPEKPSTTNKSPHPYTNSSQTNSNLTGPSNQKKTTSSQDDNLLPLWMREDPQQQPSKTKPSNPYPSLSSTTSPSTTNPTRRTIPPKVNRPKNPNTSRITSRNTKTLPQPRVIRPPVVPKKLTSTTTTTTTRRTTPIVNKKEEMKIPMKNIIEAQKLAKYAASSCQFNDVKAARKYLIDALNLLGGM